MLRRRIYSQIKQGGYKIPKRGQYAITKEENPEFMAFLWHNEIAKESENYCTFEEAAAVKSFSGTTYPTKPNTSTPIYVQHIDLRYFTGLENSTGIPFAKLKTKIITFPDIANLTSIFPGNTFMGSGYGIYVWIFPASVRHYSANYINASYDHAIYIFEGNNPPSHDWTSNAKNSSNGGTLLGLYVPDKAVDTYKASKNNYGNTQHYEYDMYVSIIFGHSQYKNE